MRSTVQPAATPHAVPSMEVRGEPSTHPEPSTLPARPRLAPCRTILWRTPQCVQFGLDPRFALVVDDLCAGLAELVRGLDGSRTVGELVVAATAAGADADEAVGLLTELAAAGVLDDAEQAGRIPPGLVADVAAHAVRSGRPAGDVLARRAGATVEVHGDGRVAVSVAVLLSSSGVGCVRTRATGRVAAGDVGTGYRKQDVGQRRRLAATAAVVRRRAAGIRPHDGAVADVAVIADSAVHDPMLAARMVADRVPHLAVQAGEGRVLVGPLVLPGRTACLRCVGLRRSERDPCWPRLAAQLANRPSVAALTAAVVAAGLATEQVLALLAGPGEPPATGVTVELDPLTGHPVRRRWPAHPRCGCGAADPA